MESKPDEPVAMRVGKFKRLHSALLALLVTWGALLPLCLLFGARSAGSGSWVERLLLLVLFGWGSMPIAFCYSLLSPLGLHLPRSVAGGWALIAAYWLVLACLHVQLLRQRRIILYAAIVIVLLLTAITNLKALGDLMAV